MSRGALLAFACLVAALVAVGCGERRPPGFPHRAHLTAEHCGAPGEPPCATCATCHAGVRQAGGAALPDESACRGCHGERTKAAIAAVAPERTKRTPIVFDHARHLAMPDVAGQCVGCHAGVVDDGVRGDVFPAMAGCLGCHTGTLEKGTCTTCHRREDLRSLVPETLLRHDAPFLRRHGDEAGRHGDVCTQCHARRDCLDCHDDTQPLGLRDRIPDGAGALAASALAGDPFHRADFVTRHAIEARNSPSECVRCHAPSTCDACHVGRGVSGNRRGAKNPHPIGWVGPDTLSPDFHGGAARRDITGCAACHEQGPATNCIRCHRVGAGTKSPHPAGWRSQRSPRDPMCRYCHGP